jgi:hypothetical protein
MAYALFAPGGPVLGGIFFPEVNTLRAALIVLAYLAAAVIAALAVARLLHWADTPDTKAPAMPAKRRRRRPYRGTGAALIASLAPASFPAVATPVTTQTTVTPQCPYSLSNLRLRPGDDARLGCVINSPHAPEASNGLYACGETVYCPVSSRRASTVFNSATPIVPPATYLLSGANGLRPRHADQFGVLTPQPHGDTGLPDRRRML